MIIHEPQFDGIAIAQYYSEKERKETGVAVDIKYVCSTALDAGTVSMDIFYRNIPHPQYGNRYFGLFYDKTRPGGLFIANADIVETLEFAMVEDDDGNLQYSRARHDFKQFKNGNMIDGGRAYHRSSVGMNKKVAIYNVKNGEMVISALSVDK